MNVSCCNHLEIKVAFSHDLLSEKLKRVIIKLCFMWLQNMLNVKAMYEVINILVYFTFLSL